MLAVLLLLRELARPQTRFILSGSIQLLQHAKIIWQRGSQTAKQNAATRKAQCCQHTAAPRRPSRNDDAAARRPHSVDAARTAVQDTQDDRCDSRADDAVARAFSDQGLCGTAGS